MDTVSASLGTDIEGALRGATGRLAAGESSLRQGESQVQAAPPTESRTKPGS